MMSVTRSLLLKILCRRSFHTCRPCLIDKKQVEEVKIPVPWGHVAGRWWGSKDSMPVIALHGLLDNGASFDRLAPLLETQSLLSLDIPGHGFSSHYPKGIIFHHFDHLLAMRYILKNHFQWEDVTLMGHSYGGSLWFLYSTLYPNDVKKFISIDGATYTIAARQNKTASQIRRVMDAHIDLENKLKNPPPEYTLDELVDIMYKSRKESLLNINKDACRVLLSRGAIKADNGKYYLSRDLRLNSKALGTAITEFLFALSEQVKAEVLYIRSTKTIIMGEWLEAYEKSLELMKNTAKRVENISVEGGHHVHLENPEIVAPIINKFLNS